MNPKNHGKTVPIKKSWENPQLQPVPTFYIMEPSNRTIDHHGHTLHEITANLSECFRVLGIQVKYFESPAGASLLTHELIEMYIYLWKAGADGNQIRVELQRRQGDSVIFYHYARHILDSAAAKFDATEYKDSTDSDFLTLAEKHLRTELTEDPKYAHEALMILERVAGLIKEDGLDAKLCGMQSLCVYTNPRKTNLKKSLFISRAVLFGEGQTNVRSMHEYVLSIVQIVQKTSGGDDESLFHGQQRDKLTHVYCQDSMNVLLNYALTIMANALELVSIFESPAVVAEFIHSKHKLIRSLLMDLDRAEFQPHNACLAAKCLRIICQSSPAARDSTNTFSGLEQAFRAEQIGKTTNARLERESSSLMKVLRGSVDV